MKKVIALQSFDHNGLVRKGEIRSYPDQTAQALQNKRLVEIVYDEKKSMTQSSSVSLQVPHSQEKTAKSSGNGGKGKKAAAE